MRGNGRNWCRRDRRYVEDWGSLAVRDCVLEGRVKHEVRDRIVAIHVVEHDIVEDPGWRARLDLWAEKPDVLNVKLDAREELTVAGQIPSIVVKSVQ